MYRVYSGGYIHSSTQTDDRRRRPIESWKHFHRWCIFWLANDSEVPRHLSEFKVARNEGVSVRVIFSPGRRYSARPHYGYRVTSKWRAMRRGFVARLAHSGTVVVCTCRRYTTESSLPPLHTETPSGTQRVLFMNDCSTDVPCGLLVFARGCLSSV